MARKRKNTGINFELIFILIIIALGFGLSNYYKSDVKTDSNNSATEIEKDKNTKTDSSESKEDNKKETEEEKEEKKDKEEKKESDNNLKLDDNLVVELKKVIRMDLYPSSCYYNYKLESGNKTYYANDLSIRDKFIMALEYGGSELLSELDCNKYKIDILFPKGVSSDFTYQCGDSTYDFNKATFGTGAKTKMVSENKIKNSIESIFGSGSYIRKDEINMFNIKYTYISQEGAYVTGLSEGVNTGNCPSYSEKLIKAYKENNNVVLVTETSNCSYYYTFKNNNNDYLLDNIKRVVK